MELPHRELVHRVDSMSLAGKREALRRKIKLSTEAMDAAAQEWRRALRRFNQAQDGKILMSEFVSAVRLASVPASRSMASWSDREIEELWVTVKDDAAHPGAGVDVEELVNFLSPAIPYTSPYSAKSDEGRPPLEDSLVDGSNQVDWGSANKKPSYMPEEIPRSMGEDLAHCARVLGKDLAQRTAAGQRAQGAVRAPDRVEANGTARPPGSSSPSPTRRPAASSPLERMRITKGAAFTAFTGLLPDSYVQQLEDKVSQLMEELMVERRMQREMEWETRQVRDETERFKAKLTEAVTASEGFAQEVQELREQRRTLEEEAARMLQSLALEERFKEQAMQQASAAAGRMVEEEEEASKARHRIEELHSTLIELRQDKTLLHRQLQDAQDQAAKARSDCQAEAERRVEAEKQAHEWREARAEALQEEERQTALARDLSLSLDAREQELAIAHKAAIEMKRRIEGLEKDLDELHTDKQAAALRSRLPLPPSLSLSLSLSLSHTHTHRRAHT
jgi:hypothetical protein